MIGMYGSSPKVKCREGMCNIFQGQLRYRFQAEIVCRFCRDRVSISSGTRKPRLCVDFAEIVCRFRKVIDWSSFEIGSDLKNHHQGGELWERGDRGVEKVSTEIENQGARNDALEQARFVLPVSRPVDRWRRPVGRPVDQRA